MYLHIYIYSCNGQLFRIIFVWILVFYEKIIDCITAYHVCSNGIIHRSAHKKHYRLTGLKILLLFIIIDLLFYYGGIGSSQKFSHLIFIIWNRQVYYMGIIYTLYIGHWATLSTWNIHFLLKYKIIEINRTISNIYIIISWNLVH